MTGMLFGLQPAETANECKTSCGPPRGEAAARATLTSRIFMNALLADGELLGSQNRIISVGLFLEIFGYPVRQLRKIGYRQLFGAHGEETVLLAAEIAENRLQRVAYHLAPLSERRFHHAHEKSLVAT